MVQWKLFISAPTETANLALKKTLQLSDEVLKSQRAKSAHPAWEAGWRRRENTELCIHRGVCQGPRGRAGVLPLSRWVWSDSQQPHGSKADTWLQRLITVWCCGCLVSPWYPLPAAPPALAAPCAPTYGHHRQLVGWEVVLVLTALVSFLSFESFIADVHRVMEYPYWGFWVSDAPFSRFCFTWHGVLKIFPHSSECWWFGGSIKRNTGIVWMFPSANCVGRTLMRSRGDVFSWSSWCSGCCSLLEMVLQTSVNFKQVSLWVLGQSFRHLFFFKLSSLLRSNLFSLHGSSFMAFTLGISAGVDRTATHVPCRNLELEPGLGGGCCFFKLPIFIFLTHQTKNPEQISLHLYAQHPAAGLSSAKQGRRSCRALEK